MTIASVAEVCEERSGSQPLAPRAPFAPFERTSIGARLFATTSMVAITIVTVVFCIVVTVYEIHRKGWDADNWGILPDYVELLLAALAALLLARRAYVSQQRGWGWLAAGSLFWALGQVAWMIIEYGMVQDPTVSVATVGFVGWAAFTTVGLLTLGGRSSAMSTLGAVVSEAAVLSVSTGFLLWEVVLAPTMTNEGNFTMAMLAVVPIGNSFVVAAALLLCLHDRPLVIVSLGAAAMVLLAADTVLTVWFSGVASVLAVAHLGYCLTFVIIGVASVLGHRVASPPVRSSMRRLVVIYVPVTLAIWVATWRYLIQQREATIVSIVLAIALGLLVGSNQVAVWLESGHLAERLHDHIARLRHSESDLRGLLDDLPEAVVVLSDHGDMIDLNRVTLELSGYSRADLIGRSMAVLIDESEFVDLAEKWRRMLAGRTVEKPTFRMKRVDGTTFTVEADVHTPLHDPQRVVVTLRDITRRLEESAELERAQTRFRLAFRSAPTGMAMSLASTGELLDVNDSLAEMLGTPRETLVGRTVQEITHPDDWEANRAQLDKAIGGSVGSYKLDKRYLRADGDVVWARTSVSVMHDHAGNPLVIAHVEDITEQRRTAAHLQWAASHDELTGLPNRTHFVDQLRQRLDGAELGSIAVLFIDLDNFKVVNDSLGHAVGDQLLRAMSDRLRSVVRDRDMLGRFGGDEFIVMLDGLQLDISPADVAERLRVAIAEPLTIEGSELYVSGSIGMAFADRPGVTADELLRDADAAMYRAKARGRDCVESFAPGTHESSVMTLRTSGELRHGLERGEIVPYYQPIVDLASGRLTGFEVLARWRHPDRGLLTPDQFLPMAEETGLIGELGAAVLRASLAQLGHWQASVPALADVTIAVNVSVRQLVDARFHEVVSEALAESGVRADSLWLEITETALMSDVKTATIALRDLRSLGLHLSVDDFGTGYSSLTYLKRFPVEAIKVDRGFVKGLGIDAEDTTIVEAVVNLGRSLGLMVVAEGVETPLQLNRLREMGCDRAQGYLFGRPRPAALIEAERTAV